MWPLDKYIGSSVSSLKWSKSNKKNDLSRKNKKKIYSKEYLIGNSIQRHIKNHVRKISNNILPQQNLVEELPSPHDIAPDIKLPYPLQLKITEENKNTYSFKRILTPISTIKPIGICYGHQSIIRKICISSNRNEVLTCSNDQSIKIWSLSLSSLSLSSSFPCIDTLSGYASIISIIRISSDYLISGSFDGSIRIYLCEKNYKFLKLFIAHHSPITDIQFYHIKDIYLTAAEDNTIKLWHIYENHNLLILDTYARMTCIIQIPNTFIICAGTSNANIYIWNLKYNHFISSYSSISAIRNRSFSLKIENVKRQEINTPFRTGTIHSIVSYKKDFIFTGGSGDASILSLYSLKTKTCLYQFPFLNNEFCTIRILYLVISNLSNINIISANGNGSLTFYNIIIDEKIENEMNIINGDLSTINSNGKQVLFKMLDYFILPVFKKWISNGSISINGQLFVCSSENEIAIIDIKKIKIKIEVTNAGQGYIYDLLWLNDSKLLSAGQDGTLKIWDFKVSA